MVSVSYPEIDGMADSTHNHWMADGCPGLDWGRSHCLTGTRETPDLLAKFLGCLVRVILAIPSHLLNFVHLLGGNERVKFHSLPVERGGDYPLDIIPWGIIPWGIPRGIPWGSQ